MNLTLLKGKLHGTHIIRICVIKAPALTERKSAD